MCCADAIGMCLRADLHINLFVPFATLCVRDLHSSIAHHAKLVDSDKVPPIQFYSTLSFLHMVFKVLDVDTSYQGTNISMPLAPT